MIINFNKTDNKHNKFIYNSCLSILDFLEKNNKKLNEVLDYDGEEKGDYFLSFFDAKNRHEFDLKNHRDICETPLIRMLLEDIKTFLEIKQELYIRLENYLISQGNNTLFIPMEILYFYDKKRFITKLYIVLTIVNNKFICDFIKTRKLLKKDYQNARKFVNKQKKE